TGKLNEVLRQLAQRIKESRETRRNVVGALTYPAILILVAISALTVMLWFVVPTFAGMFKEMGATLPGITQFVVDASNFLVAYGLYIVGAVIALAAGCRQVLRTETGRRSAIGGGLTL